MTTELDRPEVELAYIQSFRAMPEISPIEANKNLVNQYLRDHIQTPTPETITAAFAALGNALVKRPKPAAVVAPAAPVAPPETEQERLKRLDIAMSSTDSRVREAAKKELRQIIKATGPIKAALPTVTNLSR